MMRPPSSPSKVTSKKTQIWVRHARPSGPIDCWWCAILRPTSYEDDGDCLRPPPPPPVPTSLPYPTIWKKATTPSIAATVSSKLLLSRDSAIATWVGPPLTPYPLQSLPCPTPISATKSTFPPCWFRFSAALLQSCFPLPPDPEGLGIRRSGAPSAMHKDSCRKTHTPRQIRKNLWDQTLLRRCPVFCWWHKSQLPATSVLRISLEGKEE